MSDKFDRVEFAAELLRAGYNVSLVVRGYSMQPLIPDGATLALKPLDLAYLRRGDIVLTVVPSETDSTFLIHRIISIKRVAGDEIAITTRGDGAFKLDTPIRASAETVVGKVSAVEVNQHHYDYTTRRWRVLNWLLGWASFNQISQIAVDIDKQLMGWQQYSGMAVNSVIRKFFSLLFIILRKTGNRL